MADVLRTGVSVREHEVHIERPDGLRGIALVDIEGSQGLRWKHRQRRQLLPGHNGAQTQ
jgi:hypothetical protein